jgi:hypothetical protein
VAAGTGTANARLQSAAQVQRFLSAAIAWFITCSELRVIVSKRFIIASSGSELSLTGRQRCLAMGCWDDHLDLEIVKLNWGKQSSP